MGNTVTLQLVVRKILDWAGHQKTGVDIEVTFYPMEFADEKTKCLQRLTEVNCSHLVRSSLDRNFFLFLSLKLNWQHSIKRKATPFKIKRCRKIKLQCKSFSVFTFSYYSLVAVCHTLDSFTLSQISLSHWLWFCTITNPVSGSKGRMKFMNLILFFSNVLFPQFSFELDRF